MFVPLAALSTAILVFLSSQHQRTQILPTCSDYSSAFFLRSPRTNNIRCKQVVHAEAFDRPCFIRPVSLTNALLIQIHLPARANGTWQHVQRLLSATRRLDEIVHLPGQIVGLSSCFGLCVYTNCVLGTTGTSKRAPLAHLLNFLVDLRLEALR